MEIVRRVHDRLKSFRSQAQSFPAQEHTEGYDAVKQQFIDSVLNSPLFGIDEVRGIIGAKVGDPQFDAISDVFLTAPATLKMEFTLKVPDEWKNNEGLKLRIDSLAQLADQRGNAAIRLIDERVANSILGEYIVEPPSH